MGVVSDRLPVQRAAVPRHFTVKSLAEHLGVSRSYVKKLIANREIGFRRSGEAKNSRFLIPEPEVEKWLERRPLQPSFYDALRMLDS